MFTYVSEEFTNKKGKICKSFTTKVYENGDNFVLPSGTDVKVLKKNREEYHCSYPISFDIETTAYDYDGEERRAMFLFALDFDTQFQYVGRTFQDLQYVLFHMMEDDRIFHIFVHNLSYETYFILQPLYFLLNMDFEIKLLDSRKVWQLRFNNIIFHDSAVITGASLENSANDWNTKYFKATGDFDYNRRYTTEEPIDHKSMGYMLLDTLALTECMQEHLKTYNQYKLYELPKTKTGFVRKDVLRESRKDRSYRNQFLKMALTPHQYEMCRDAFEGGYTAGSPAYYGEVITGDIRCRDITSSYPFQILSGLYPIGKFAEYQWSDFENMEQFIDCLYEKSVIATYTFTNVRSKTAVPHFSVSKALYIGEYEAFNGKLISTDYFERTMTEVAFLDFCRYYDFDEISIDNIMMAKKGELPKFMLDSNIKYFTAKSTLKGVDGKEREYMSGKANLNSIYGMSASRIDRDEWYLDIEDMECGKTPCNLAETLDKYYSSENSCIHYQWACYVTSYARHQVYEMMDICGDNWIYTDTDSVYYISTPEIEESFETYNMSLCRDYQATTSKGKITTLGEVTPDGEYKEFVQYGAKKYCKRDKDGELHITVAGVPKSGVKQLQDDIYNFRPDFLFQSEDYEKDGIIIEGTHKLRPQYIYTPCDFYMVNGIKTLTASGINLLPCDYKLSGVGGNVDEVLDALFHVSENSRIENSNL